MALHLSMMNRVSNLKAPFKPEAMVIHICHFYNTLEEKDVLYELKKLPEKLPKYAPTKKTKNALKT